MRIYLAKRILFFIPALLFVVLLSFILLHYSPGDPVERILNGQGIYDAETSTNSDNTKLREDLRHRLGLDLPLFYFSVNSMAENDSENISDKESWKIYIPVFQLHEKNQFHRWVFGDENYSRGIIRGDFGNSWITNQPVASIIFSRLKWSLFFTVISVLLAYLISVPVGLRSASRPGSAFDRTSTIIFTILFSLPAFWVATFLMLLFCNADVMNVLPSSGVSPTGGFPDSSSLLYRIIHTIPYLILPTLCYTYSSFAFLSRSIKVSITEILHEDYIKTARAKGLDEKTVINKHAFRNALLPMITIFSQVFPFAIGGSVILETIFTIPGMGLAVYQSISTQDYPVIIAVFMITGFITMISFLISDLLYMIADPRISFTKEVNT
jgi:peptide/nickel transport system permease protein